MATVKLDPAKGIQIPNLTTTERNAISSPETGAIIWNTTTSEINQYNGSAWEITYTDTNTQIAGITSSADATAITIDSSENVGIGTTSPSNKLQVKSSGADTYIYYGQTSDGANGFGVYEESDTSCSIFARNASATLTTAIRNNGGASFFNGGGNVGIGTSTITDYSGTVLQIHNATNARLKLTNDTTGTSSGVGASITLTGANLNVMNRSAGELGLWTSNTERVRIETAGQVVIPGGVALGTAIGGYAAANTLDDYEKGTWTPQNSSGTAYTINGTSRYVKVGRLVHFMADVNQLTSGSSIYGLPFTSVSGAGTGMSVGYTSYGGGVYIYNLNGSTRMDMHTIAGVAISSNNHRFIIGGTYYASS